MRARASRALSSIATYTRLAIGKLSAGRPVPQRRVRLLERLGLHRRVLELPEVPVEGDPGLRPQRLHQRDPLAEPCDIPSGIHAEGGERPPLAASAHADLDPAAAELV